MKEVVVDASVAVKWVIEEEHGDQALSLLWCDRRHAPDHWLAEAANALWPRVLDGELTAEDAEDRLGTLLGAPVVGSPIARLMPRAHAISVARRVTIYNSLYVALAEKLALPLVTADQVLIRRLSGDAALAQLVMWLGDIDPEA